MTPIKGQGSSWLRVEVIVAAVLAIAAGFVALTAGIRNRAAPSTSLPDDETVHRPITGGQFEASGVAHVNGTNALFVLDDDTTREIFLIELAPDGSQKGPAVPVALGADVTDMEGITSDGTWFYVAGSQSKATGFDGDGLIRFRFDPGTRRITDVERVRGLKAWLAGNVAELLGTGELIGDHVLNIEAIAWDPDGGRLLLGLRAPVTEGQALVIPLKLVDPEGRLTRENIALDGPALRIDLGGAGIRSLEYDPLLKSFRLITGASLNEETLDFRLVEWNGKAGSPVREITRYSRKVKPEGITRAELHGRSSTVMVFDVGTYSVVD